MSWDEAGVPLPFPPWKIFCYTSDDKYKENKYDNPAMILHKCKVSRNKELLQYIK